MKGIWLVGSVLTAMTVFCGCGDDGEDAEVDTENNDDSESDEAPSENTQAACEDGEDNDDDGDIDCADADCASFCPFVGVEWPEGFTPKEVGLLVAENFAPKPLGTKPLNYSQGCTWYGALQIGELLEDQDLLDDLVARFDPILTEEDQDYISREQNVDAHIVGIVPLEIYMINEGQAYLDLGLELADAQWAHPQGSGITGEARFWADDMFMITGIQVQAFRASEDPVYRERAALTMAKYIEALQDENGLFYHTRGTKIHWNRANGWAAVGMSELLSSMKPGDDYYDQIMEAYTKMMAALLTYQTDNGLWVQVVDYDGEDPWEETSGSAMFTFAFITGVNHHWLDAESYAPAAIKAWTELVTNHMEDDGDLIGVCIGTGEGYEEAGEDPEAQLQYYMDRPTSTGDYHGQAPLLWSTAALLR